MNEQMNEGMVNETQKGDCSIKGYVTVGKWAQSC